MGLSNLNSIQETVLGFIEKFKVVMLVDPVECDEHAEIPLHPEAFDYLMHGLAWMSLEFSLQLTVVKD
jgi:hypothetical protein